MLHRIGAIPSAVQARLSVTFGDGAVGSVVLDIRDAADESAASANPLIASESAQPGRWRHGLDAIRDPPAIYRNHAHVAAQWLGDHRVLYVLCNDLSVTPDGENPANKLAAIVVQEIRTQRPKFIVVDLRMNPGGNFLNSFLFAHVVPRMLPPGGKVYVLIGPRTLSSAIATTAMLKARGRDRVVLVGEPMGDNPQFWADSERMILPNSKLWVQAATQFEDWENGCDDLDRCLWLNVALGDRNVPLAPEVLVPTTFASYAAGRDVVLETVLRMALESDSE